MKRSLLIVDDDPAIRELLRQGACRAGYSCRTAASAEQALEDLERMGQQFQQWLLGFQLSAAFAVARGQSERRSGTSGRSRPRAR